MSSADFLRFDTDQVLRGGRTAWLAERMRQAIMDGTLASGVRLPASRVLAGDLGVARGTVVEAYRRLAEEGLLVTNRGGGTVVAELSAAPRSDHRPSPRQDESQPSFDASSGLPDLSAFPRSAWLQAERRILTTATSRQLGYADPQGVPELRVALASWLARSRGVDVQPDRVIITAGVTGGLSLLAQVLRDRGIDKCAVEDPGAEGNRRILDYWMDTVVPVPVDGDGLDVDALAKTGAQAVLVTPAHQFPTGVVLAPIRRRALVAWADRANGLVVEDDYDAEYRYDRVPVRAMQAMAPERVVHVSSLSKVLAPGLRIGWVIAPGALHDDLVRKRWATDLGSPVLSQLVVAELIVSGRLERHLRSLRVRHRERRDAAVEAIGRHLPGCTIDGIAAGLHLVIGLPESVDDTDLATQAQAVGIDVHSLSVHRSTPGPPGLVIGYGSHLPSQLDRALKTLSALPAFRQV